MKERMNTYKLSIYAEEVRNCLKKYDEYRRYLDGIEVSAANEDEARDIANKKYNVMQAQDIIPAARPEIPCVNDYWDLWSNPKYTKIEKINCLTDD